MTAAALSMRDPKKHEVRRPKAATSVGRHRYMQPVVRKLPPKPEDDRDNYFFGGLLGPKYPGCLAHRTDKDLTKQNLYAGCFAKIKGKSKPSGEPKGKDMSALIEKNRRLWWDSNVEKNKIEIDFNC